MSITSELREWFKNRAFLGNGWQEIHDIADHIDAEHERKCKEQYHGYIELPKDADGVPWNVGDRDEDGNEVFELVLNSDGWYLVNGTKWVDKADSIHHYHTLTVEDVLRNVVTLCHTTWKKESPFHFYNVDDVMKSGNIAEFAAKLQLKED